MQANTDNNGSGLIFSLPINSIPLLHQYTSHQSSVSQAISQSDSSARPLSHSESNAPLLQQPTSYDTSGHSFSRFVSNRPFSRQTTSYNNSLTQPTPVQLSTRPAVLTEPEFLYTSKAFKFLIYLDVSMVAAPFMTMVSFMWIGEMDAGGIFLRLGMIYVAVLPIILIPRIIWFAMMMPFSHVTKR